MAIQTKSLASAEHDWYATRSGLDSNAPLTEHKAAYFASRGFGRENWSVRYRADELPEAATPAWTPSYVPDPLVASTVEISPAGILHIVGAVAEYVYWSIGPDFVDATGVTLETSVQIVVGDLLASVSGKTIVDFADDGGHWSIEFYTDGIRVPDFIEGPATYAFDTTDGQHVYRMTKKNSIAKVYVDGVLRLQGTITVYPYTPNIEWQASDESSAEQNWDYLYYDTTGAYAPGENISEKPLTQMEEEWLLSVAGRDCGGVYDQWVGACQAQSITIGKSIDECKFNFFTTVASGTNP